MVQNSSQARNIFNGTRFMEQAREAFENRLYDIWAKFFDLSTSTLTSHGSSVMSAERLKNTGWVDVIRFDTHTIVQCDIVVYDLIANVVQDLIQKNESKYAVTRDDIQATLAPNQLVVDHILWLYYLYPADFKLYRDTLYTMRQLSEDDEDKLNALKSACTPEDISEGWVHVTDELCYGAFTGDKMIACGSMYDWRGFADPGVLVHPNYRRRGLGKAVVSAICQWVLDKGRIMTYRCGSTNHGSAGIAQSLGFTHYFEIEVFKVVNDHLD
jgi:GNAT superfamily N-acetyltransferase